MREAPPGRLRGRDWGGSFSEGRGSFDSAGTAPASLSSELRGRFTSGEGAVASSSSGRDRFFPAEANPGSLPLGACDCFISGVALSVVPCPKGRFCFLIGEALPLGVCDRFSEGVELFVIRDAGSGILVYFT